MSTARFSSSYFSSSIHRDERTQWTLKSHQSRSKLKTIFYKGSRPNYKVGCNKKVMCHVTDYGCAISKNGVPFVVTFFVTFFCDIFHHPIGRRESLWHFFPRPREWPMRLAPLVGRARRSREAHKQRVTIVDYLLCLVPPLWARSLACSCLNSPRARLSLPFDTKDRESNYVLSEG